MTDVSVIIPVYKVEAYLDRCVESVLAQSFESIQIVLVDDGSPDCCAEQCDRFAASHDNVFAVHKGNGGLSSARNAGLKIAEGEYVYFVDSDDWIDSNAIGELFSIAEHTGVDFVRYRAMYANWPNHNDGDVCEFGIEEMMREGLYSRQDIEEEIVPILIATPTLRFGPILSAWASFFRRSFLQENELWFYEDVRYSEDSIFSAKAVWKAKSFYYLQGPRYYHYFYNYRSISKSYQADLWEINRRLISHFKEDFANIAEYDFSQQIYRKEMFCVLDGLSNAKKAGSYIQKVKRIHDICKDTITREAISGIRGVKVHWKLQIILWLIKYRMAFALAMI